MRKFLIVSGIIIALLLFLLAVAMMIWGARARQGLATRFRAIRAAGEPVTMADLGDLYYPVPEDQNAAILLEGAFGEWSETGMDAAAGVPYLGKSKAPTRDEALSAEKLKLAEEYVQSTEGIALLIEEACKLEECRFDLDFTQGFSLQLRHLSEVRNAARLCALNALVCVEHGDSAGAARWIVNGLRLGKAIEDEPLLISELVRVALHSIAVSEIERWASRCRSSAEELISVETALERQTLGNGFWRAMVGERCFGIDSYMQIIQGRRNALGGWGTWTTGPQLAALKLVPKAYFRQDLSFYIDVMDDYVAALRLPYPKSYIKGASLGDFAGRPIPKYYILSRMLLPALSRSFQQGQHNLAQLHTARVALAVERFRLKHGRLPGALADLVPALIPKVPADPFDGKPLRYKATAKGFVVYSVNQNKKDDGGKRHPKNQELLDRVFEVERLPID